MTGIELIAQERAEQIEKHGRTVERDVRENWEELLRIGAIALINSDDPVEIAGHMPYRWGEAAIEKMANKTPLQRLIIAGALIAAEIDRIQAVNHFNIPTPKP